MSKPNVLNLKRIASANPTSEAVFLALSIKKRSRRQIDLRRFKKVHLSHVKGFNDADYYKTFEELAEAEAGQIRRSSRNIPRKFEFFFTLKSVGEVGIGAASQPRKQPQGRLKPVVAPPTPVLKIASRPVVREESSVVFALKSGEVVKLKTSDLQEVLELARRLA